MYRQCKKIVNSDTWTRILALCDEDVGRETLPAVLERCKSDFGLPDFLPELARLEWAVGQARSAKTKVADEVTRLTVNPGLQLLKLSWKNLPLLLNAGDDAFPEPEPGNEFVLVWIDPSTGYVHTRKASSEDLLVLKMVVEGIDPEEAAVAGAVPVGTVDRAIYRGIFNGLLIPPRSSICRDASSFPSSAATEERFLVCHVFTLQWHITQACDLHCKHCYDRSARSPLKLQDGLKILDDLRAFCLSRHVRGQVSFTGGNPLLYPHFLELYRVEQRNFLFVPGESQE